MDLGLYRHSRTRFWSFIVVPVAVVSIFYVCAYTRRRSVDEQLRDYGRFSRLVPDMEATLGDARRRLDFTVRGDTDAAQWMEELRRAFTAAAGTASVTVVSLAIEEAESEVTALDVAQVAFRGEGTLGAIMECADSLQAPGRLVTLDTATMGLMSFEGEPTYEIEIHLRFASTKGVPEAR